MAKCARCGHEAPDDYEVLQADVVHDVKCEHCGGLFWFLTYDCAGCGEANAETWPAEPTDLQLATVKCHACATRFRSSETEVAEAEEGWPE